MLIYVYWDDLAAGKQWIPSRSFLMENLPCIPGICFHWFLTQCICQYKVDLKKRGDQEKILLPTLGKCIPQDTKKNQSLQLPDPNISIILTLPAPCPRVKLSDIIGHVPSLPLNGVILGKSKASGKLKQILSRKRNHPS